MRSLMIALLLVSSSVLADQAVTVLPSRSLVADAETHAGKVFKIMVTGEGIMGIKAMKKGGCEFQYLKLDDGGFGASVGYGHYAFEVEPKDFKICQRVAVTEDDDTASVTLIVQFTALLDGHNAVGGKITIPVLKVQKVD